MKHFKVSSDKGFTLVESLIIIAIIGIMVAIASPSFVRQARKTNFREAAGDFASEISYWRQRAVAENRHYRILIDTEDNNNRYEVKIATIESPNNDSDYVALSPPRIKKFSSKSESVKYLSTTFGGTPPRITIQPRGTINPMGSVTLTHDLLPGSQAEIIVNLLGRVRVEYTWGT